MLPMHPLGALKQAIGRVLAADAGLTAFLAGAGIADEPPRGAPAPYAQFAEATVKDRSTASSRGNEVLFGILFVGRAGEGQEALAAAARLESLLVDAPLVLDGHHLIGLFALETQVRRPAGDAWRITLRLRALTETAGAGL